MSARAWSVGLLCWSVLSLHAQAGADADAGASELVGATDEALTGDIEAGYRGQISVTVNGFRNSQGRALVTLFRTAAGFPGAPPSRAVSMSLPIVAGAVQLKFEHVAPGPFAVTVLHDEDGDAKVRTSVFGIPKEGVGYSRNPRARFGPPAFDDCAVQLGRGRSEIMTITMIYY